MTTQAMTDTELLEALEAARATLSPATWDAAVELADEVARRNRLREDRAHAAFHRVTAVRYGRVERRPGYRGRTVCLHCYRGLEWHGRFERLEPEPVR